MHKIDLVVLPEQKPIFHLQLQMKPADTEADHLNFPIVLNLVQSLRYLDIHGYCRMLNLGDIGNMAGMGQ